MTARSSQIDEAVHDYIDAVAPERRPLFDRVHQILLEEHPDVAVVLKYNMPTYELGDRGLHVAAWKHGLSLYGWDREPRFRLHEAAPRDHRRQGHDPPDLRRRRHRRHELRAFVYRQLIIDLEDRLSGTG